jgi:hypothetical protein
MKKPDTGLHRRAPCDPLSTEATTMTVIYRIAAACAAISANLILISCSGPSGPQPGTPAFDWAAAKETYAAGDYAKTTDNLEKVIATENEFTPKARPFLLVVTAGMAHGYMELADRYETGARANRSDPIAFRRNMSACRTQANQLALHFAEYVGTFLKNKDENIALAFSFPTGSATPPVVLTKIASGIVPTQADVDGAQKQNIEHAVLLAACSAAGAPDDPAKAAEIFKAPDAKVTRAVFVTAMASALFEQSQLYDRQKLDDPEKMKIFCTRAQDALKTIPETKQTKELGTKIEKALKAKV